MQSRKFVVLGYAKSPGSWTPRSRSGIPVLAPSHTGHLDPFSDLVGQYQVASAAPSPRKCAAAGRRRPPQARRRRPRPEKPREFQSDSADDSTSLSSRYS